MAKKIAITGAAGFIGSHLVDELVAAGHARRLLLLAAPWQPPRFLPDSIDPAQQVRRVDIRDRRSVTRALSQADEVYHLAAKIDFNGRSYAEYYHHNVAGTANVVRAAIKHGVRKVVVYSSIGVYGMPADTGDLVKVNESHPPAFTNWYGRSKWEAEEVVRRAHRENGLKYAIIRPASVYGPREVGPTLGLYRAIHRGRFAMVGDGRNQMHYVFVKDLVKGTLQAAASRRHTGEYILAGARPTPFAKVAADIAASIGRPPPARRLPYPVALGMAVGLQAVSGLLRPVIEWQPPLFPSRVRTMVTSYSYNISRARRELGYRPRTSFQAGARQTGRWYLDQGWL
ncbi:MAG: hypothetical protein COU69_04575 [Candidatus Pacebacteria bacterium CG10_big_fil_rev_8_21_14_0_10_56_10]|nr:MAG: hypothetical protein COU69_04575 [Candidatus Pacebacteria bacterium CG10_big_fil_rev_8_21_14_0_10_56_10]